MEYLSGVTSKTIPESSIPSDQEELLSPWLSLAPSKDHDGFLYDVLLSFRREDTEHEGFIGRLCQALSEKSVRTFMDRSELEKAEKVEELFGYVEKSNILMPIFSKGYAGSKWCLKELAKIMKCRRPVIPVFIDVQSEEVRNQSGRFEYAFKQYAEDKNLDEKMVGQWRDALREAGEVSGFTYMDGHEAMLVQMIAKRVLIELGRHEFDVEASYLVGLDDPIQEVIKLLDLKDAGVRMVGIHGMSGIGKTVLAKAVYNAVFSQFQASTFLSNVKHKEITGLQKQLFYDFDDTCQFEVNDGYYSPDHLTNITERIIRENYALVVLDDIDDAKQVRAFACCRSFLTSGGRVILTTADRGVLARAGLEEGEIFELKRLNGALSLQLFSYHAFGRKQPMDAFTELSRKLVSIAGGVPLVLEVYGSLLFDKKTEREWIHVLEKLEACQHKEVHEMLKVSFDELDEGQQQIFLDIACFFIGCRKEAAEHMWRECGFHPDVALAVLQHRSLIKINENHEFEMRDLIRDMGRQIVINEDPKEHRLRSRLWETKHIQEATENPQETSKTECIVLPPSEDGRAMCFNTESFENMERLRLLDLSHAVLEGEYKRLPKKLKWLKWRICHVDSFPSDLHLENMVILDLSFSKINRLWSKPPLGLKTLSKLKILVLSNCGNLVATPNFSCMPSLEKLVLDHCFTLMEVHESIGQLGNLMDLSIRRCFSVQELPNSLCNLTSLQHLDLGRCNNVSSLQSSVGNLRSLKYLDVSYTDIDSLRDTSNMKNLLSLDLSYCHSLVDLPESIGCLVNLQRLSLDCCCRIKGIPNSIGNLKNLRDLNLNKTDISELPDSIGSLEKLVKLRASSCEHLKTLPPSLVMCRNLQLLHIGGWTFQQLPENIGNLTNLKRLFLDGIKGIQSLPSSFQNLSRLRELNLYSCGDLKSLAGVSPSVIEVSACDCSPSVNNISSISNSMAVNSTVRLEPLSRSNCISLIKSCGLLPTTLRALSVKGCSSLVAISHLSKMKCLKRLSISSCFKIQSLPQLPPSLVSLSLSDCARLVTISDVSDLKCMEELSICKCNAFESLPQLPPSIKRLYVSGCPSLATISDITNLNCLKELTLGSKWDVILADVPHLENLNSSQNSLLLTEYHRFQYPPQLPSSLESLTMTYYPPSGTVPYITSLKSLTYLDLSCCRMKILSGLETLQCLKELHTEMCTELSLIAQLPLSLTKLSAYNCAALETVPDVSNLKSLRKLNLRGCAKLVDVVGLEKLNGIQDLDLESCLSLSSDLFDRIMKVSNFKDLTWFGAVGRVSEGGKTLSFTHPNFFGFGEKYLETYVILVRGKWTEWQMCTQVVMDGCYIFEERENPTTLEEDQTGFSTRYRIVGELQKGNAMVIISFGGCDLQLESNYIEINELTTTIDIRVSCMN